MKTNDQHQIRIHRRKPDTFARIPHEVLEDAELSAKAKGLLCYLLGKPDHWQARVADITKHMKDGKYSVRTGLQELRDAGYAKFEQNRGPKGRLSNGEWLISDEAIYPKKPLPSPRTNSPRADNPDTENWYHSKNDGSKMDFSKKETSKEELSKESPVRSERGENISSADSFRWKPDQRTPAEKLKSVRQPKAQEYPSEREFTEFIESEFLDRLTCHRPDLYQELCKHKWHHWKESSRRWLPIRDWRTFITGLDECISESTKQRPKWR